MKKALHIYHVKTSFTQIDDTILKYRYQVEPFSFEIKGVFSFPGLYIKQLSFLLRNLRHAELVFCMFAGYHTWLPVLMCRIFHKPCCIVAGGIDCVSFPAQHYGNFSKPLLGVLTRFSFKYCTRIFPISEYLVKSNYTYADTGMEEQGIRHFIPNLKTPVKVIYNGFETKNWYYSGEPRKAASFLTIAANLDNPSRVIIKGIDLILETAALMPEADFTIIGRNKPDQSLKIPENVRILPLVPYHELKAVYCAHRFYLQLSMSEGFGNTLAESMLCECVPVGSEAGAIPMIIGDCGYLLYKKDSVLLRDLLRDAVNTDTKSLSQKARQRILENFSIEKRKQELFTLLP